MKTAQNELHKITHAPIIGSKKPVQTLVKMFLRQTKKPFNFKKLSTTVKPDVNDIPNVRHDPLLSDY